MARRVPQAPCAQAQHEEELSALRSQLGAKEEQTAGVAQELAAAKAALSAAEQVLHPGLGRDSTSAYNMPIRDKKS